MSQIRLIKITSLGYLIVILFLIGINFKHLTVFKNRMVFWQNAVATAPGHPLAHKNLGSMYFLENDLDRAELEYNRALELNSHEIMVHNNLGVIYMNRGEKEKAKIEFERELTVNPGYDKALKNLQNLLP